MHNVLKFCNCARPGGGHFNCPQLNSATRCQLEVPPVLFSRADELFQFSRPAPPAGRRRGGGNCEYILIVIHTVTEPSATFSSTQCRAVVLYSSPAASDLISSPQHSAASIRARALGRLQTHCKRVAWSAKKSGLQIFVECNRAIIRFFQQSNCHGTSAATAAPSGTGQ